MKLLQLNVWGGRLEHQVMDLLKSERPDFICLQEAISIENSKDSLFFLTVEQIAEELQMNVAYAPVINFSFMDHKTGFGNAILSKQAVDSTNTIFTESAFVPQFNPDQHGYNVRNLLHTIYSVRGQKLNILTHHGHHVHAHKNGDDESMRQCKVIADYAKDLDGAVVLCGDFNLSPQSESLQQINSVLTNLSIQHHVLTTRTALTHKTEVCDYIFVNDQIAVTDFTVSDEVVSDHAALIMEFDISVSGDSKA